MAKRRYRSALRSERMIRDAYVALAKGGKRISASAICRQADLNRSTFYAHYDSVEDLESRLVTDLMEGLAEVLREGLVPDFRARPEGVVTAIGAYVEENRELFVLSMTSSASFSFGDRLRAGLLSAVGSQGVAGQMDFDYVAGGLTSMYRTWVLGQYGDVPVAEVNARACALVRTLVKGA